MFNFLFLVRDCFVPTNISFISPVAMQDLGKFGILFYNSAFMVIPAILLAYVTGEFERAASFEEWTHHQFQFLFFLVCVMGLVSICDTLNPTVFWYRQNLVAVNVSTL